MSEEKRYELSVKMDLAIVDYQLARNHDLKIREPLGEAVHINGTKEEIKEKICEKLDTLSDQCYMLHYGIGPEEMKKEKETE